MNYLTGILIPILFGHHPELNLSHNWRILVQDRPKFLATVAHDKFPIILARTIKGTILSPLTIRTAKQ